MLYNDFTIVKYKYKVLDATNIMHLPLQRHCNRPCTCLNNEIVYVCTRNISILCVLPKTFLFSVALLELYLFSNYLDIFLSNSICAFIFREVIVTKYQRVEKAARTPKSPWLPFSLLIDAISNLPRKWTVLLAILSLLRFIDPQNLFLSHFIPEFLYLENFCLNWELAYIYYSCLTLK